MTTPLAATPATAATVSGCPHFPPCPAAEAVDHDAAVVVAVHHDQGWVRLCNNVIVFEDTGELIPDDGPTGCHSEPPHRPEPRHCADITHTHCPCSDEESTDDARQGR